MNNYGSQCSGLKWIFDVLNIKIFAVISVNECIYGLLGLTFLTGDKSCSWTTYHLDQEPLATFSLANEFDLIGDIIPFSCSE